jgi:hypothetical protein
MAPEDLEPVLEDRPPAGILTGFELKTEGFSLNEMGGLERPLEAIAGGLGYRAQAIVSPVVTTGLTLWVAPDRGSD